MLKHDQIVPEHKYFFEVKFEIFTWLVFNKKGVFGIY